MSTSSLIIESLSFECAVFFFARTTKRADSGQRFLVQTKASIFLKNIDPSVPQVYKYGGTSLTGALARVKKPCDRTALLTAIPPALVADTSPGLASVSLSVEQNNIVSCRLFAMPIAGLESLREHFYSFEHTRAARYLRFVRTNATNLTLVFRNCSQAKFFFCSPGIPLFPLVDLCLRRGSCTFSISQTTVNSSSLI